MHKILAPIACMMAVAMFSACGSQDVPDSPPPDYSKYSNIERIDEGANDRESDASDIEAKKTGYDGNIIAGVTFTGSLDNRPIIVGGDTTGITYDVDFYTMKLKRSDSLNIKISNYTSPFRLRFYGPCHSTDKSECADTAIVVKNEASLQYRIRAGHEEPGVSTAGDLAKFYIKIFKNESADPNNYLATITVKRY